MAGPRELALVGFLVVNFGVGIGDPEHNFQMEGRGRRLQLKEQTFPRYLIEGIDQEGFEERFINDFIGRGVFATKKFLKAQFLLEYKGELITQAEGYSREESYDAELGSFLFFFKDGSKCFCVDATFSSGLGRLVNDALPNKANCNCVMRKMKVGSKIHLALYALRDIMIGEELRYDYGVKDLPWRSLRAEGITASSDSSANLEEQSNKSMVKMGDSSVGTKLEKDKSGEHSGDSTNMEVQMEGRAASSDNSANLKEQSNKNKSMVKMGDSVSTKVEKDKSGEHSGDSTNMEVQMERRTASSDGSANLKEQSNKIKSMVKMDDSSVSSTKLEKDKSREHSGDSTNMDDLFPVNISTSPDISSMNQNNCLSMESFQRFQQWKLGLKQEECWINDEGMNTYNALLARKFKKMGKSVYIFSTFFLQRWKKFEKHTPEVILQSVCQVNLLEKEKWVIPVNDRAHWKVIIVNLITKSLCLYDSTECADDDPVNADHFQAIKLCRKFIQIAYNFWGKTWISQEWKQGIARETPKQANAFDCGIFSLKFVDHIISGKPLSFSQDDMPRFREDMAREIITVGQRSDDYKHQNEQTHQLPDCAADILFAPNDQLLNDRPACKIQVKAKDCEADLNSDKNFQVANSESEAESEEFNYSTSTTYPALCGGSRTNPSLELKTEEDDVIGDTDEGVQYSNSKRMYKLSRKRLVSSSSDEDNYSLNVPGKRKENVTRNRLFPSSSDEDNNSSNVPGKRKHKLTKKRLFSCPSGEDKSASDVPGKRKHKLTKKRLFSCPSGEDKSASDVPASVRCAQKSEFNRRVYDKKQACFYCGVLVSKIARHYELKHMTEKEVAIALSFNKGSPSRKKHLEKLRLLGNYHHNLTVMETGKGELIVYRRPTSGKGCNPSDFLPCNFCLGFIKRQELWKHVKSCKFKPDENEVPKYQKVQEKAKLLLFPAICSDSSNVLSNLFAAMKSDEVTLVARNDWLIKELGVLLIEKHGDKQNHFVSQKMRELARLLLQLRTTSASLDAQLSDFIKPGEFDVVVSGVKALSKFHSEDGVQHVAIPSLSLKIGHSLKKCVNILRGHALRRKDKELQEDVDNFEKLIESEWNHRVSHHSLGALGSKKFNNVELLPLAEDLEKLRTSVLSIISSTAQVLQEGQPQLEVWNQLAQATLARLVMFNKRRGGEASRMLVESYVNRPDWSQVNNPEIMSTLSDFERQLSKRLDMVEIVGKRGRKVPVILTAEMTRSIDLLIKTRKAVGIQERNPYVFARPNRQSLQYMRGWDCLRKFSTQCEPPLSNPANVTSTKLRKYIATISQVLSMEEKEVDWLARHLGHDIRVHRDFYRLHESTIEIAKVSKLLLTVDQGDTGKFAGKTLEEIELDDIADPDLSDDTDCEIDDGDSDQSSTEADDGTSSAQRQSTKKNNAKDQKSKEPKKTRKQSRKSKEGDCSIEVSKKPKKTRKQSRKSKEGDCSIEVSKKSVPHKSWTGEEKEAVLKYLGHWIRQGRIPGKLDCEQCISKTNGVLDHRKWSDVKFFIKNQIDKRRKVLAPKN
ncbi:uncharacterized protein [Montipora capricornis]|uniref:uncharacterized protein isoform X3 n=1 Tax=Montipora capricornis TaxID=246305 RepID=UPI0035F219D6